MDLTLLHRNVEFIEDGFDVGILTSRKVSAETLVKQPLALLRPVPVAAADSFRTCDVGAGVLRGILAPSSETHGSDWCFADTNGDEEIVSIDGR